MVLLFEYEPLSLKMSRVYQTLSHHDHVLKRPDSYVGSITPLVLERWLAPKVLGKAFEHRNCRVIPALPKLFDEILMNARDNSLHPTNPATVLRVQLTNEYLRVENNGECIPVTEQDGKYIPSLVFFTLLTSEHFDDSKARVSAGLNGYGCKVVSIFSSSFTAECHDPTRGLLFEQTYTDNMTVTTGPRIRKKKTNSFTTRVTFTPDAAIFGRWNNDVNMALYRRRVLDVAATHPNVKVYLNGTRLPTGFKKYMPLYTDTKTVLLPTTKWDVGLAMSATDSFQAVSFVNGVHTPKGGTHVTCLTAQLTTHIQTILRKRNKKSTSKLSKRNILHKLFVFVNATVTNPHFGSQTKEELTTEVTDPPQLTVDQVAKAIKTCGVLDELEAWLQQKEMTSLQKKMNGSQKRTIRGIPKLNDAQRAGTADSSRCSLILTEGDSAASMAITGLSVVGRKFYGVMPLKGKLLNVRSASKKMLLGNKEIQHLIKIVGLQLGKQYTDTKSLRYGQIIIMSDQDVDGFHIGGLLLNFLDHFWPSLTNLKFVQRFMTPLLKVGTREFFDVAAYTTWKAAHPSNQRAVKYYKGLGTSTNTEAKAYFRNLGRYVKQVVFDDQASRDLDLVFNTSKADQRKAWMTNKPTPLDYSVPSLTVHQLVQSELLSYAHASLQRAIPSAVDGLKESQRKILFASILKVSTKEMKVAQLAAYIADRTEYTHGEQSLCQAIVKLAQDYPGSNNVPLLKPNGQFGSRQQNGADAASPRYIYTQLQPYTRHLFSPEDDPLLTYRVEEGTEVEPEYYVPVVPMLLVNGCNGIATGYRTLLLPCKMQDVIANLRRLLRGQPLVPMTAHVRGYRGVLDDTRTVGTYTREAPKIVSLTELPYGVSIVQYKTFLHASELVSRFEEHHTDDRIHFRVHLTEPSTDIVKDLHLEKRIASCWNALDVQGRIKQYGSREDLLREFFVLRMNLYAKRKQHQLAAYAARQEELRYEQAYLRLVLANPRNPTLTTIPATYREKFRKLPMSRLEQASMDRCAQECEATQAAAARLRATTPSALYEQDLSKLDTKKLDTKKRKRR